LRYSISAMARESTPPLIISEMAMMQRPAPLCVSASLLSSEFGAEQQKALARIADYPKRVERLRRLWCDIYNADHIGSSRHSSGRVVRPGSGDSSRSRSSSRLANAGAAAVGTRLQHHRSRARSCSNNGGGRYCRHKNHRGGALDPSSLMSGPLTARQIQELMTRDLTPEDYELLLLLDEGVKKARTLSSSAAASLPRAEGTAWHGEECRICLCALEEGEDVRMLPGCGHLFHAQCAERWLGSSKATCPLCGVEVPEAF